MCPSCVQEVKSEEDKHTMDSAHSPLPPRSAGVKESLNVVGASGCNCNACVAKR